MRFDISLVLVVKGSVPSVQSRGVSLELLSIMAIKKRCKQTHGCIYYFCWEHLKNTSQAFQFLLSKHLVLKYTGWCPIANNECSKNPLSDWMCFQQYFTYIYSCFLFLLSAFISFLLLFLTGTLQFSFTSWTNALLMAHCLLHFWLACLPAAKSIQYLDLT